MNIIANAFNLADIMQSISGAVDSLGPIAKYIAAILIFLIGKVIAKGIAKFIEKLLAKTSLDDKLANRIENEGIEQFVDFWESISLW